MSGDPLAALSLQIMALALHFVTVGCSLVLFQDASNRRFAGWKQ